MDGSEISLRCYLPDPRDETLVREVLRSGRLSHGPMAARLEAAVAGVCGCSDGVAVTSPRAALALVTRWLSAQRMDEVVLSPFAPPTLAEALVDAGMHLVLADVDPVTLNIDPKGLEAHITDRTRAILFTHTFGNPLGVAGVAKIAARYEIPLIEDATEALGTRHKERPCGAWGRVAVLSLGQQSATPCGGGGVIVTDDARLADDLRGLRTGRTPTRATEVTASVDGLSDLHAALGVGQLRRLEDIRDRRTELTGAYLQRLMDVSDIIVPTMDGETDPMWPGLVVRLDTRYTADERDRIVRGMRLHEVEAEIPRPCLHQRAGSLLERQRPADLPIAESVQHRLIRLPFHLGLSARDVEMVVQTLELMISRENLSRG